VWIGVFFQFYFASENSIGLDHARSEKKISKDEMIEIKLADVRSAFKLKIKEYLRTFLRTMISTQKHLSHIKNHFVNKKQ
jgi:hypothetical protein